MKVTFVSNYINHHQIPLSNVLYEHLGENYHFIQTEPMEEERVRMGWNVDGDALPYLRLLYCQEEECQKLIAESDVVIFGGTEREELIGNRLESGLPVIRYSERIYKEGQWRAISPRGLKKKYHDHTKYYNRPVYLLCAGAYVASDFHIIRAYKDKMFRWGYFPECRAYDIDNLMRNKNTDGQTVEILWAGRFISWKHVEMILPLAVLLKEQGQRFHITVVGDGEAGEDLKKEISRKELTEQMTLTGFQKPQEVRKYMEKAHIFLATSDYKEGWGAVVNEAMNSGCAVVASHAMGAVPFLIRHGENGLIFKSRNEKDLCEQVLSLVANPAKREALGRRAYESIRAQWNAKTAGERLLQLCEGILTGDLPVFEEGPVSKAPVTAPHKMYREIRK